MCVSSLEKDGGKMWLVTEYGLHDSACLYFLSDYVKATVCIFSFELLSIIPFFFSLSEGWKFSM